jgi:hypothetical protein
MFQLSFPEPEVANKKICNIGSAPVRQRQELPGEDRRPHRLDGQGNPGGNLRKCLFFSLNDDPDQ